MTKYGTVKFTGESGTEYKFTSYSRDTKFAKAAAVFFMTKRNEKGGGGYSHHTIYVGQTGDLSNRPLDHERKLCFDREGANCVCVYVEDNKGKRFQIEVDLRKGHEPPCNRE